MANTYKNIVITPNRDTAANVVPEIRFAGGDANTNTDIYLKTYTASNGTLSFEGSVGQLFSITNDLSNVIFSVNDVSGIPSLEIDANGVITMAEFGGNVGIGNTNPTSRLHVDVNDSGGILIRSTLASNTVGPRLELYRDPPDGTTLDIENAGYSSIPGEILFTGKNTANQKFTLARIYPEWPSYTANQEYSTITFGTTRNGNLVNNFVVTPVGLGIDQYSGDDDSRNNSININLSPTSNDAFGTTIYSYKSRGSNRVKANDSLLAIVAGGVTARDFFSTGVGGQAKIFFDVEEGSNAGQVNTVIRFVTENPTLDGYGKERLRIQSTGNVLIGRNNSTVGQNVKLDVVGAINASAVLVNGSPITSGTGGAYYQGNNGDVGSASGLGDIFRVHTNILNANVTIYSGNNALAAGPITVNVGKTLTIQTNARVSIV